MKYLTIIALLFSMSAFGQTGITLKLDSAKWAPYTIKRMPVTNSWTFTTKHTVLMKVSDQKPDSTYHVWIDKKAIIWTSDSTFILKRKN